VEAHKLLKSYLYAIEKEVADKEVVQEVELRMSELLMERGVTGDKVILPADVTYLKEQLGSPDDFSDQDEATPSPAKGKERRLFRDPDNALIAGVAAGVANYSGLDVVLVRLIFVLLTIFSGGIGIVLYLLFWLIVPPAETASEKLQMQGKPVTLEALKDSVNKADVGGAARRINATVLPVINRLFSICVKLAGLLFVASGLGLVLGAIITKVYVLLHNGRLFQENLFPVGARENLLMNIGLVLAIIFAIFLVLIGVATFKRKWPIGGWITGVLAGIFLIGSAASLALAADAAPRIRDRYEASLHTTAVKDIGPFNNVVTTGQIDLTYVSSPTYAVNIHYTDHPDLSKIKIKVSQNTLYIDSTALDVANHCAMLCLFPRYDMTVQIYAPNVEQFKTPPHTDIFYPAPPVLN
jgi:phage shock protein PspC (stress-responsive transcriptional regulator)